MAKYHISKNGEAKICTAKKRACRYEGEEHFESQEQAQSKSEEILSKRFGNVETIKRDTSVRNNKTSKSPSNDKAFTVSQLTKDIQNFAKNTPPRKFNKRVKFSEVSQIKNELLNLNNSGDRYFDEKTLRLYENKISIMATFQDFDDIPTLLYINKRSGILSIRHNLDEIDEKEDDDLVVRYVETKLSDEDLEDPYKISEKVADLMDDADRVKDWGSQERAVAAAYLSNEHYRINEALRNNTASDSLKKSIEKLERQHTLKEERVVYRGLRNLSEDISESLSNGSFNDGGLLSTSTNPKIALGFSGNKEGSIILKITLPKSTECWDMSDDSENEIILPRNFDLSRVQVLKLDRRLENI